MSVGLTLRARQGPWTDHDVSTPLTDIRTAKTALRGATRREALVLRLPTAVAKDLAAHPSLEYILRYADRESLLPCGLPGVLRGLAVTVEDESPVSVELADGQYCVIEGV